MAPLKTPAKISTFSQAHSSRKLRSTSITPHAVGVGGVGGMTPWAYDGADDGSYLPSTKDPRRPADRMPHDWRSYRAQLVASELRAAALEASLNRPSPPSTSSHHKEDVLTRPKLKPVATMPKSSSSSSSSSASSSYIAPDYSAAFPNSWAHRLPDIEPGCLLIATNDSMQFFGRSIVLVTAHDAKTGTVGCVLNKPSPLLVSELQVLGSAAASLSAFGSQRLHLGGPVHLDHITLLHRYQGIATSIKIAEGVYSGGLPEAMQLVQAGLAQPADFKLVLGMAGWAPQQLASELKAGHWTVVAASPDLMLPPGGGNAVSKQAAYEAAGDVAWRHILKLAQ